MSALFGSQKPVGDLTSSELLAERDRFSERGVETGRRFDAGNTNSPSSLLNRNRLRINALNAVLGTANQIGLPGAVATGANRGLGQTSSQGSGRRVARRRPGQASSQRLGTKPSKRKLGR